MSRHHIGFAGRKMRLPQSRASRIALGTVLILGGLAGFLPILGFWMIPFGIAILSIDLAIARRLRRRVQVRWGRRRMTRRETS
jgi:Putative transmembrane protein (PGPGW)